MEVDGFQRPLQMWDRAHGSFSVEGNALCETSSGQQTRDL